jgi:hypothetical protein
MEHTTPREQREKKVLDRGPEAPLPYVKGSDTSQDAADSMREHADRLRREVYNYIADTMLEGLTCDEVEDLMSERHQTISARVNELRDGGLIVDTGARRRTRSNRKAAVYVATKFLTPEMLAKIPPIVGKSWKRVTMSEVVDVLGEEGCSIDWNEDGYILTLRGKEFVCDTFAQVFQTLGIIISKVLVESVEQRIYANAGKGNTED